MGVDIYSLRPINRTAATVTSQRGVSGEDSGASPREINEQRMNMIKKRRYEIGNFLGIKTKAQRRNYMYRIGSRPNYIRNHKHSSLLEEWYRIGKESSRLTDHLRLLKDKDPQCET